MKSVQDLKQMKTKLWHKAYTLLEDNEEQLARDVVARAQTLDWALGKDRWGLDELEEKDVDDITKEELQEIWEKGWSVAKKAYKIEQQAMAQTT